MPADVDLKQPPRNWGPPVLATLALLALLATVGLVVVGVVAYKRLFPSSDAGKARAEVQRWYDNRWPNLVTVDSCRYANPDSDYDFFSCRVRVRCRRGIVFSVPRAAELFRSDDDAAPVEGKGTIRCGTPNSRRR